MKAQKKKGCNLLLSKKNICWSDDKKNPSPLELLSHKESDGMLRIFGAFPIQQSKGTPKDQELPKQK